MQRRRPTYRKPIKLPKWTLAAVIVLWWVLLVTIILTTDPAKMKDVVFTGLYFPMLLLVFLAVSGSLFILRKKFWPSVLWALGVSIFLILRLYGWGNMINLIVIGLCLAVWEGYWRYLDILKQREKARREEKIETIIDSE
jgi:hypothetical protein